MPTENMGYLSEQVAYLRGLAEGMKIDESKNEGKLLANIIDVLGELAANLEDLNEEMIENDARIEDLEDFAQEVIEEFDDCDCDCDCDCDDCDCDDCDCDCEYDEDEEDLDFYEVECPSCKEKVYFDEDMLGEDELICPNCEEKIEIEFDFDEEE